MVIIAVAFIFALLVTLPATLLACKPNGVDDSVEIGGYTYICLVISAKDWATNHTVLRMPSKLTADKLSTIRIPTSWTSMNRTADKLFKRISTPRGPTPTRSPTSSPTFKPTPTPTDKPTPAPSSAPTDKPTPSPSAKPTLSPTPSPTGKPTRAPTMAPSISRTPTMSYKPTESPTFSPTRTPTELPTFSPTQTPTYSYSPTESPTVEPTSFRRLLDEGESSEVYESIPGDLFLSNNNAVDILGEINDIKTDSSQQSYNSNNGVQQLPFNSDSHSRMLLQRNISNDLFISVESMGTISYQRVYRGYHPDYPNITVTYPLNLAIINVNMGKVKSITWSDTCSWCEESGECAENIYDYYGNRIENQNKACFIRDTDCLPSNSLPEKDPPTLENAITNSLCELHVYIAWTGTDAKGNYLSSAGSRFDRLDQAQLMQFVESQRTTLVYDNSQR